jgi:aerobic-type carbon monoxide dehydrogenase small subunit (CoxS/CutS family)
MANALALRVNGREERLDVPAHHTLLEALRDELKLRSVREGCGIGMCGACTVLLDGKPVSACLMLAAMAEGHDVLTVEGLGDAATDGVAPRLDPIQEAFLVRTGFQCSYCTPGILLTARALLAEQPDATDEEIREYLAGNLCRCGSYVKILDSMHEAIARLREMAPSPQPSPARGEGV